MVIITYEKNEEDESYNLLMNGETVAHMPVIENEAIKVTKQIQKWIDKNDNDQTTIVIQNDNDNPPLGIIIDLFYPDMKQVADSATFWFDDFK
jgi:hypothetical protein